MLTIHDELEALELFNYEQKPFIPYESIKSLLNHEKAQEIVSEMYRGGKIQVYQQQEIIKSICSNGLRLFATLLSFSRPELIGKFIERDHFANEQLDSRLPFSKASLKPILQEDYLCSRFSKHQWRFLPPFLSADQSHRELADSATLPFLDCKRLSEGGFGEVFEMTMPAACQNLVPQKDGEVTIIRKLIKRKSEQSEQIDFDRERHTLSLLRCLRHPNIIQLLTTYTINENHNFLFPLAEGNLKMLLSRDERPAGFQSSNHFFQAIYQIASAVEAVHNYFSAEFNLSQIGCHYDLKPENVLYCNGTLILSDFGLSRLVGEANGSKSWYRNGGGEYMAPESVSINDDFENLKVGRSSDMWSFGCILSEILTYIKKGHSGVAAFSEKREIVFAGYWTCKAFHAGDKPHPRVLEFLSNLDKNLNAPAERELLAITRGLLQIEPSKRPKSRIATIGLFHAAQNDTYCSLRINFSAFLASHLDLQIEYERLLLWGEYSGIATEVYACQYDRLDDRNDWKTFADLQLVQDGLHTLECELENLASILKDKNAQITRLAYHVQRAIDNLWSLQPLGVRRQMTRALETRLLSTDDILQLKLMQVSEKNTSEDADKVSASFQQTKQRIGLLATMKQIASGLRDMKFADKTMEVDRNLIKKSPKSFHWHFIGSYGLQNQSQVLIEHLEYGSAWYGRTNELIQRVQDIAHSRAIPFAKQAFPILKCVAFYHDVSKHLFGIVYEFPPRTTRTQEYVPDFEKVISLRDIFSIVSSRKDRPSLDVAFALAANLLSIVAAMHNANWLHKSISSYNIVFFPDRFSTIAEAMESPYFIGFNYSRLNLETAFTQGPNRLLEYQHPEYLRNREKFRQEYEYFSVGLVLLEIGLWSPLEEITSEIYGAPEEVVRSLLELYVPVLKTYMGTAYAKAVAICLSGDFGDSANPVEVREAFDKRVLRRIEMMVSKRELSAN